MHRGYKTFFTHISAEHDILTAKDKDKEALFNVAFKTDNINHVELFLRHNEYQHLPAFLYLPDTTLLLRASAREIPVPFYRHWYDAAGARTPTAPEADALTSELSGR